jgi:hypothetical protein
MERTLLRICAVPPDIAIDQVDVLADGSDILPIRQYPGQSAVTEEEKEPKHDRDDESDCP